MKLENLKVGMVVRNYPELCKLLDLKPNSGNAKIKQMNWIGEYIEYEKEGYKFIIKSISDRTVEPMEDNRGGAYNVIEYVEDIEKLILNLMLKSNDDNRLCLSKSSILRNLNLVNDNYGKSRGNIKAISEIINLSTETLEDYFDNTDNLLKGNVESALSSLENQRLVMWNKAITVRISEVVETKVVPTGDKGFDGNGNLIDIYEKIPIERKSIYRNATLEESLLITRFEREAMENLGCRNVQGIVAKKLWRSFKNSALKLLRKNSNIEYYHTSYNVYFNREHIEKQAKRIEDFELSEVEKTYHTNKANKGAQERNLKNATNRQSKASIDNKPYRMSDGYLSSFKWLNNMMIDLKPTTSISDTDIWEHKDSKRYVQ